MPCSSSGPISHIGPTGNSHVGLTESFHVGLTENSHVGLTGNSHNVHSDRNRRLVRMSSEQALQCFLSGTDNVRDQNSG